MGPMLGHLDERSSNTLIGVGLSIAGNLLISVALNLQKLAHQRLTPSSHPIKRPFNHPSESSQLIDHHLQTTETYPIDLQIDPQSHQPHGLSYLSSPVWWTGFILMFTGELGNFVSYGFAPASVVAPLGTIALIGNCFIAPVVLGEEFRRRDWLGIGFAIIGTITIVMNSPPHSEALEPDLLLLAISQLGFILFASLCLFAILSLMFLSNTRWADQFIGIDVGLCAICGGFTVLSTKAFSSLLNVLFLDCFNYPITWFMMIVILVTAMLQIIFLNRALQRFDSKQVVPVQFVLFTIMAVIGSTTLYGDFKNLSSVQVGNFVSACGFIFTGVYILTRDGSPAEEQILPTSREQTEFRSLCHSPNLAPVSEESLESSDFAELVIPRATENGDSMNIESPSIGFSSFSELNRFTCHTGKSLQFSFTPPPGRVIRRQGSQPILFPRAFGTPGYYLIANSSTPRSQGNSHGFPVSGCPHSPKT